MSQRCIIYNCNKPKRNSKINYCNPHYRKLLKYGDPLTCKKVRNICKIDLCLSYVESNGLCYTHYRNYKVNGSAVDFDRRYLPKGKAVQLVKDAVKSNTDDCITLPGRSNRRGGRYPYNGKKRFLYTISLLESVGEPPKGKTLALHKPLVCHNPGCFNPKHLYWGNHSDNQLDAVIDGTKSSSAKITKEQAIEIYNENTLSRKEICEKYGLKKSAVQAIKIGKNWRRYTLCQ